MKSTHKEFEAIVGLQTIRLLPGQFVFGRKKASEETDLSEREIRTALAFLKNAGNLTIKTTNKFSIITIVNWITYQGEEIENDQQGDQLPTSYRPHTRTKEHKNIPSDISEKISNLKSRYNSKLVDRVFQSLASTRKSGKVSDSTLLAQLEKWAAYPQTQVETAIRTYLEKGYAAEGKGEKYLMGIIRNGKPQTATAQGVPDWY